MTRPLSNCPLTSRRSQLVNLAVLSLPSRRPPPPDFVASTCLPPPAAAGPLWPRSSAVVCKSLSPSSGISGVQTEHLTHTFGYDPLRSSSSRSALVGACVSTATVRLAAGAAAISADGGAAAATAAAAARRESLPFLHVDAAMRRRDCEPSVSEIWHEPLSLPSRR
jgi:hypothetical protein